MDSKKAPGRFTLQFHVNDPHQRTVIDILNQQGRNKAQFLTSAVLHYINCSETPEYQQPAPSWSMDELEQLVLEILNRRADASNSPAVRAPVKEVRRSVESQTIPDAASLLDSEDLSAIVNSLAAFRSE